MTAVTVTYRMELPYKDGQAHAMLLARLGFTVGVQAATRGGWLTIAARGAR